MDTPPSIPSEDLAATPPSVLALIQWQARQIAGLTPRLAELEAQVALLTARLNKDSSNSSTPPPSAHPHAKPASPKPESKRRRGGQPGHPKAERALIPVEDCRAVVPCIPGECRRCGRALHGTDLGPLRHQVWELPEIRPVVTEYQQHRLICACGCSTCGDLPAGVPGGRAGPRLVAFAGLLMASFRQSKRRAARLLGTILDQPASASWMVLLQNRCAEAVQPAYDQPAAKLPGQPVLDIDESPTKEGPGRARVWTFVADTFTFFACRTSRAADTLEDLLGKRYPGVIHCDRAKMYWRFGRLQWCRARLERDVQPLIDSPCHTRKRLGHDLMRQTRRLFELWKRVRDGTITRSIFVRGMRPVRAAVESLPLRGYFNALTRGFCKGLWKHRMHLWTFVEVDGVEPTNNAAERALRPAVIWRKLGFGAQSAAGSRFVERMLTVIETTRRAGQDVFAWLTEAVQAHFHGKAAPPPLVAVS